MAQQNRMLAMVNDMFYRMQSFLHEYWHIVGYTNLFCKLTKKFKALMDSTPKFASCSNCTDFGFCTFGQHWQKIWEIVKFLTFTQNNILNLLGLTNLGTKCENVVCKYEQVRELRFETASSFCILRFASCIFQKFAGGKNILF